MSEHINSVTETGSGTAAWQDYTIDKAKNEVQQYPYFAPAQFFLLKSFDRGSAEYSTQYQKAILYHKDVLEFESLMQSGRFETSFVPQVETPDIPVIEEEQFIAEEKYEDLAIADNTLVVSEEKEQNPDEAPQELVFEPFHTVDYFASQGIKGTQEAAPTDSFGKQVKSFTDWLKTMKRLSPTDISKNNDPQTEKKVVNLAIHSLDNLEVATEAMAEVWIKQGNNEKATGVYRKLSLLNPSKSAYFAAKIELLKKPV